jgi:hypothetical protein
LVGPRPTGERSEGRHEFQGHEHLRQYVILAAKAEAVRGSKSEVRVILGVADHDDRFSANGVAALQALSNQQSTNSAPLELWGNGHEPKSHQLLWTGRFSRDGRKEDVTNHLFVELCDERYNRHTLLAEGLDQVRLRGSAEGGFVYVANRLLVAWLLESNHTDDDASAG